MRERVEHLEQLERALGLASHRRREYGPQRRMRVLPAILAHTRKVAANVSGIVRRTIERRRQEHDQTRILTHQLLVE